MAIPIRIRRRHGSGTPPAGTLKDSEPAVGFNGGRADVWIGENGTNVLPLITPDRQLELNGTQAITTGAANAKTFDTTNFRLLGGNPGSILARGANNGDLQWVSAPGAGTVAVEVEDPIKGDGTNGDPLTVTPATDAQIAAGTDDVFPITAAGLRSEMGDAASELTTTEKTVVPAINELAERVNAVSGSLQFVGNYDADESEVVTADSGTVTVGNNLPAPSSSNEGWFVIVTVDGTPAAPAPQVPMNVGDWIVSTGDAWIHVPLQHSAVTAANVGVTAINATGWTNVQQALAALYSRTTAGNMAVVADEVSITGDGTTGDPLAILEVDGGTW